MSAASLRVTSRAPARPGALIVVEGYRLPPALAKEARRQWKRTSIAVVPTLGKLPSEVVIAIKKTSPENPVALTRAFGAAGRRLCSEQLASAAVVVPAGYEPATASPVVRGIGLGLYRFDRYKTSPQPALPKVAFVSPTAGWTRAARAALPLVEGALLTRDLINTPAEHMGPSELEQAAREVARQTGMKIRVLGAGRCERMGMGALTAVGRASTRPPRLIVLEHQGAPRSKGFFAFAGKGIVFDTGGLDLKPPSGMLLMKKDMGGAATLLGAALALGQRGVRKNLRFYLAVAENSVAGNAIRPGDVVTALDGTTIEIGNTDAEGRLVLADAIALAVKEGARRVLDIATLTGAAMIALGRVRVPMMSNDDAYAEALAEAADAVGEKVWRLPGDPEFREHIKSKIAEIKNVGKGREAGVIAAGLFLEHFAKDLPWAHLDISPASWADSAHDLGPEGATGAMVPTLVQLAEML